MNDDGPGTVETEMGPYEYGKVIQELRKNLNDGYECPNPRSKDFCKIESSKEKQELSDIYESAAERIYEHLKASEEVTYADINMYAEEKF